MNHERFGYIHWGHKELFILFLFAAAFIKFECYCLVSFRISLRVNNPSISVYHIQWFLDVPTMSPSSLKYYIALKLQRVFKLRLYLCKKQSFPQILCMWPFEVYSFWAVEHYLLALFALCSFIPELFLESGTIQLNPIFQQCSQGVPSNTVQSFWSPAFARPPSCSDISGSSPWYCPTF